MLFLSWALQPLKRLLSCLKGYSKAIIQALSKFSRRNSGVARSSQSINTFDGASFLQTLVALIEQPTLAL